MTTLAAPLAIGRSTDGATASSDEKPIPEKVLDVLNRKAQNLQNGEITLYYNHGKVTRISRLERDLIE